jgi:hypothetical protein
MNNLTDKEYKKLEAISTMVMSKNNFIIQRGYGLLNKFINNKCRNSSCNEFYNVFRR